MSAPWAQFVILDDEESDAIEVEAYLRDIFRTVNLEIGTKILKSSTEARGALETHPDFFICDVRLESLGEVAGLELIQNLKPKFPHVNFVAMTMQFEKLSSGLSYIVVQPDFIWSKAKVLSLRSDHFDRYLLGYFIVNRRQNRWLEIKRDAEVERTCKRVLRWPSFNAALFDCLVKQVFRGFDLQLDAAQFSSPEGRDSRLKPDRFIGEIVDHVKITCMDDQGESGSAVFKAETRFRNNAYKVGLVLKFCPIDGFLSEVGNFSRFVKWMLPYSWRVDILGDGISENFGLIAYSLAMDGSSTNAQSLSRYIAGGNSAPVLAFIDQVFSKENRTWYAALETATGRNLTQDLLARYFSGDQNKMIKHVNSLRDKFRHSNAFLEIYNERPFDALNDFIIRVRQLTVRSRELDDYETCICHGDLHSGNIMVGERKAEGQGDSVWQFAFIDFQDTGRFHIGTDFVVFENAIRKDSQFGLDISLADYYHAEKELILGMLRDTTIAKDRISASPLLKLICATRDAFIDNFELEGRKPNREHFVFHLFVFTLFMINDKFAALERREILLVFFCAVVDALTEFRGGTSDARPIDVAGPSGTAGITSKRGEPFQQ